MCLPPLSKKVAGQLAGHAGIRTAHWLPDRPRIRTWGREGDELYSATRLIRSSEGRRLVYTLISCVLELARASCITSDRIFSSFSGGTALKLGSSPSASIGILPITSGIARKLPSSAERDALS